MCICVYIYIYIYIYIRGRHVNFISRLSSLKLRLKLILIFEKCSHNVKEVLCNSREAFLFWVFLWCGFVWVEWKCNCLRKTSNGLYAPNITRSTLEIQEIQDPLLGVARVAHGIFSYLLTVEDLKSSKGEICKEKRIGSTHELFTPWPL